ncbi:MAG: hypothetical protein A2798_01370 [Candidatus Levybacteria bacterium RIFCSPHIGHO2_01_FULL_37_17]|nr:MAG: hypothetical protein A2798_01370 [Candidatus Levybacteria bacterium RIFCSPHIGHO2_01_FULL_37_17]OGH37100.1 MAG: hypothetical protein A2959_02230 [Candidatus Levybacteria bacterium RIFCSPLOWO2_01_FULL_38_23]
MPNIELHPQHSEHSYRRGGKLTASYADKKVRQYDTFDPRIVVDLPSKGKQRDKIIIDKYSAFESGIVIDLDRIEIIRGHHKARLVVSIGRTEVVDGEFKHEVYSPHGLLGYAHGEKLDLYLASLFYDDPKLKELSVGHGHFDREVEEYLEKEFETPGLFK